MKMGKEVLAVSSGKTRDDPSMWPMRAFVTVDDYELQIEASCPGGTSFTLRCNEKEWDEIPFTNVVATIDGKTKAPELNGSVTFTSPRSSETLHFTFDEEFPLPWSQENGRTLMSCVTAEENEGFRHVNLTGLDCPIIVVHDLFKIISQQI